MKPKELAKLIGVLNDVYLANDGKSDVAKEATLQMQNLIKLIPELMNETKEK